MTRGGNCDTIPVVEYEESTGYVVLRNGKNRQVVCKKVGDKVVIHHKFSGKLIPIPIEDWNAMFTT